MLEELKTIGAILGIIAFGWKLWDAISTYLHIKLKMDHEPDGKIKGRTTVENKGTFDKRIDNALILIGPENESPIDTINAMEELSVNVKSTNAIAKIRRNEILVSKEGRILIPLPFYYSENLAVGDEILTYTTSVPTETMIPGKTYSARFFVWTTGRYHRSTHDCFTGP